MKKLISFLLVFALLLVDASMSVYAIDVDNSADPWTIEKADHLARRALFRVTPEVVQELLDAGSAEAAVDLIFTDPRAVEVAQFSQEIANFMVGKSVSETADMEDLYMFDLYRDPFDAKRKAFTLLEDIFSVAPNTDKNINYSHIRTWHQTIYEHTLGDFKDLVYQTIYSYAQAKYLTLLDSNTNNPNEDFARELMQLFLMEEYLPLDPDHLGTKNYSEEDVHALAFFLTGFTSPDDLTVIFNPTNHNNTARDFLGETYQPSNTDPAEVVSYIFEKKENQIAQFIAWRFYKFYISETLTQSQLDNFVDIFIANDFQILPLIKAMLVSDDMYSDNSMNEIRYKNPLELSIGTQVLLQQENPTSIDTLRSQAARTLGFRPYSPPSIFGRGGMDKNAEWMNSFLYNQWFQMIPDFVFSNSNIWSVADFVASEFTTPLELIEHLEDKIYLGRTLPDVVRTEFIEYLTTENNTAIEFTPDDVTYQNNKIRGLLTLMMVQPEYLLQSGYDQDLSVNNNNSGTGRFAGKGAIILLSYGGGADWLQLVAPTTDPTYQQFRGGIALQTTETTELDNNVRLNNKMSALLPYYQSGELRIINNVGLPGVHSRSHSFARQQMESGLLDGFGAIAKGIIQDTSGTLNQISMFSGEPRIFQGATNIAIGNTDATIDGPSSLSAQRRNDFLNSFKDIIGTRQFPGDIGTKTQDALTLDTIARTAGTPGNQNDTQFDYVKTLIQNNVGKVYYMRINGGYDTHGNQRTGMDNNLERIADRMTAFYEEMKTLNEEVTLVTFSEFGRTNRVNGNLGTDHGQGGGMMVLSNEGASLRIPSMVGTIDLASESRNWLAPKVDVRAVWNTLMEDVLGINIAQTFPVNPNTQKVFSMVDYTAEAAPKIVNISDQFNTIQNVTIQFEVEDEEGDFDTSANSTAQVFFGTDKNFLTNTVTVTEANNVFQAQVSILPGSTYYYKIVVSDNNGNTRNVIRTLRSPRPVGASGSLPNGMSNPFILDVPTNITANPIVLATGTVHLHDSEDSRVRAIFKPRTRVTGIQSLTGGAINWSGQFSPPTFTATSGTEMYNGSYVKGWVHLGPTDTSIALTLDTPFVIYTPLQNPIYYVDVYHSYDGDTWALEKENVLVSSTGSISFETQKLGNFMFVDHPNNPPSYIPEITIPEEPVAINESSLLPALVNITEVVKTTLPEETIELKVMPITMTEEISSVSNRETTSESINDSKEVVSFTQRQSIETRGRGNRIIENKGAFILPRLESSKITFLERDISLKKSQGVVSSNMTLASHSVKVEIASGTKFTTLDGKEYSGIMKKPQILKPIEQPFVSVRPGKEVSVFHFGVKKEALKASKDFTVTANISGLDIDWGTEDVKLFYFDEHAGEYKLVKDGGSISADKKTLSVKTQYANIWGVFITKKQFQTLDALKLL